MRMYSGQVSTCNMIHYATFGSFQKSMAPTYYQGSPNGAPNCGLTHVPAVLLPAPRVQSLSPSRRSRPRRREPADGSRPGECRSVAGPYRFALLLLALDGIFCCVCMHKCMHVCMYVCLYVCMYVHVYVCKNCSNKVDSSCGLAKLVYFQPGRVGVPIHALGPWSPKWESLPLGLVQCAAAYPTQGLAVQILQGLE